MIRWAAWGGAAAVLITAASSGGCVGEPTRIESRSLVAQASEIPERLIIIAVANEPTAFVAQAGSTPRGYEVVDYGATSRARRVMNSLEKQYRLTEVNAWPVAPLQIHCAVLRIPEGTDRMALLEELAKDQRIKLTQPLQTFATRTGVATPTETATPDVAATGDGAATRVPGYNDPYVGLQRGFQQMDVVDAHPLSRGEGVKVAIIDTGADVLHPDLRANIAAAANFVDDNDVQFRRDRHGTEMAGLIAAVANNREGIVGIAPNARLLIFKACWQLAADADEARCNSFTLARALAAAYEARVQVVNLSLAGPDDPLVGGLIREGLRRGVLFVGAAPESSTAEPQLLNQAGIIEVAGAETISSTPTTLYAPDREILTLLPGGRYDFASGTSIATAQVSGVVALMLARDAALSSAAAYRVLQDTSSPVGAESRMSVDACAAVVALLHQGACRGSSGDRSVAVADGHRIALH